jgi:CYTH domain-containing protein
MTNADGVVVYKFCKKYGKRSALSEPITNLYLTEKEYQALSSLDGDRMHKRRYGIAGGAIDVIEGEPAFAVFEVEFESEREAEEYLPPPFAGEEITGNHAYTGAAIAARLRTPRRRCDR